MKKITAVILLLWLILVGFIFFMNVRHATRAHEAEAFNTARSFFRQIVITRLWNAGHNGVYVPITENNPPNPYLEDPLRDLTTNNGIKLTKINPAYMTRQIAEIAARKDGIQFHITSLRPIRPANTPTDRETRWLKSFEKGIQEQGEFVAAGDKHLFRYMAPLFVKTACLQCHAEQGYHEDDIRGGISITIPVLTSTNYLHLILGYGIVALAGFAFILISGIMLEHKQRRLIMAADSMKMEIKERRRTEQQNKMLARFPDENPNPVLRVDHRGMVMYANRPGALLLKKWTADHDETRLPAVYRDVVAKALEAGRQVDIDLILDEQSYLVTFFPVVDDGYVNIYGLDITAQQRAEKEKSLLSAQLQQAYKMETVGTLAGGIAHDFNNILAIIIGNVDIVMEEFPENSAAQADLTVIMKAANRAKDLVKQILSFSRKSKQDARPIQPRLIVREVCRMLRSTLPSSVEIEEDIDPTCGSIIADPIQIQQVIMNLATNAVQAMDEKGVLGISLQKAFFDEHDLAHRPDMVPGAYIRLSISDTGGGIAAGVEQHIFDPFFTTKDIGKGTGMGLSVVHGIVTAHHGMITVGNERGRGATFHVYFSETNDELMELAEQLGPLSRGDERILLVDDEEMVVDLGCRILERQGYQTTKQTSSREALDLFRAQPDSFDLVITDQTMPGMTGKELAKELLKIRPDMPIILSTGYSSQISDQKAVQKLGIRDFLMKPYERRKLTEMVRQVLDDRQEPASK